MSNDKLIKGILNKYHSSVAAIYLYGSYAVGTQTSESDIDISVRCKEGEKVNRYDTSLNETLSKEVGKEVHIVFCTTPNKWEVLKIYPV